MNRILSIAGCLALFLTVCRADTLQTNGIPELKSPVAEFRSLLGMTPDLRQKLLAKRSAQTRVRILEKIREYSALSPAESEARLQATEMSWYLLPLLNTAATNRSDRLGVIPPSVRQLIEARLRQWDGLPSSLKAALLNNQQAINYLSQVEIAPAPLSPPAGLDEVRRKLKDRLDQLVQLRAEDKVKVLRVLPDTERQRMEQTLHAFEQLPPEQRDRCILSVAKFATLSHLEQQEFLNNARQWSHMSAGERQSLRELVTKISIRLPAMPARRPAPPTNG